MKPTIKNLSKLIYSEISSVCVPKDTSKKEKYFPSDNCCSTQQN